MQEAQGILPCGCESWRGGQKSLCLGLCTPEQSGREAVSPTGQPGGCLFPTGQQAVRATALSEGLGSSIHAVPTVVLAWRETSLRQAQQERPLFVGGRLWGCSRGGICPWTSGSGFPAVPLAARLRCDARPGPRKQLQQTCRVLQHGAYPSCLVGLLCLHLPPLHQGPPHRC
jgi:hypothetical protein